MKRKFSKQISILTLVILVLTLSGCNKVAKNTLSDVDSDLSSEYINSEIDISSDETVVSEKTTTSEQQPTENIGSTPKKSANTQNPATPATTPSATSEVTQVTPVVPSGNDRIIVKSNLDDLTKAQEIDSVPAAHQYAKYEQYMLDLINKERAKAGVPALKWNETTYVCSQVRVKEVTSYFSHYRKDGTSFASVYPENGITPGTIGENITYTGYAYEGAKPDLKVDNATVDILMEQYMNSEPHRKAILSPEYTSISLAFIYEEKFDTAVNMNRIGVYNVQNFWCSKYD